MTVMASRAASLTPILEALLWEKEQELPSGTGGFPGVHHIVRGRYFLGTVPGVSEFCPLVHKEVRMFLFKLQFQKYSMELGLWVFTIGR